MRTESLENDRERETGRQSSPDVCIVLLRAKHISKAIYSENGQFQKTKSFRNSIRTVSSEQDWTNLNIIRKALCGKGCCSGMSFVDNNAILYFS